VVNEAADRRDTVIDTRSAERVIMSG